MKTRLWNFVRRWAQLRDPSKDLGSILANANGNDSLADRILWLSRLVSWVRGPKLAAGPSKTAQVRLRFLVQLLQRQPEWRAQVRRVIFSVLTEADATSLFAQTELTEQSGLFSEIIRRIGSKLAPLAPRPGELVYVTDFVFSANADVEWINELPAELWEQLLTELGWQEYESGKARDSLSRSLAQAVEHLAVQASALSLTPEIRHRSEEASKIFMRLSRIAMAPRLDIVGLRLAIDDGRTCVANVYKRIETAGVSLQLLYRLEAISAILSRAGTILSLLDPLAGQSERRISARNFFAEVVTTRIDRRSVGILLQKDFDVFSRKLVEHAGETGEHYITRTRREYWHMLWSGGKGGLIMVPTTLLKLLIVFGPHLPLFFEGAIVGTLYAGSFLLMQAAGASLATKQPAMTAAALAEKLSTQMDREKLSEFALEVVRITRSQFIAAVGNVGFVVPPMMLVCWIYSLLFHHPIINGAYAQKTILSFHPWKSPSLFYASIAGVLLWFSSLCAGWVQNWVIYREVPEAIAQNRRLNEFLGAHRCRKLGEWVLNNASGIGGNVSIGYMLAFAPVVGHFFGLPIDIRHITISSAQLTIALMSADSSLLTWQLVVPTIIGVGLIGVLNFYVSTALALFVAIRAKRVRGVWVRALLRHVARLFVFQPWRFLLPPSQLESQVAAQSSSPPH